MRSGHTEAAVDLCKLAGLPPVGVICELANDDGTVMVGPQIAAFAEKHKLQQISVADLIAYRQAREKLVERVATFPVKTPIRRVHRLRLRHAIRFGAAFRAGRRRDRRWPRHSGAPASRRHHRRRFRRRRVDQLARWKPFKNEGRGVWSICATARRACRPIWSARRKSGAETTRARTMARHRPRRANPAQSRRFLDPPAHQRRRANMSGCRASALKSLGIEDGAK